MRNFQLTAMEAVQSRFPIPLHHQHVRRSTLSRRGFLGASGAAVGALVGAGMLAPAGKLAAKTVNAAPNPIPNGETVSGQLFRLFFFGPGKEPATINDFNGFVGVADVRGTGTATNPDGSTETLLFDTDMRFMKGVYVAQDGGVHKGTFGFV
jgi:hypothetical protein